MDYSEYLALQEIYSATNGDHWVWSTDYKYQGYPWVFDNFSTNNPCRGHWQGLYCNMYACPDTGCRLFVMNMTAYNLSGTLPLLAGKFKGMLYMTFSENNLHGPLPELTGMPSLQTFNVSYNQLSGQIPDTFYNFNELYLLYLSNNRFDGTVPPSIYQLPALQYLNLYDNLLQDTVSSNIGNLTQLLYFNIAGNMFHGTIPQALFALPNITQIFYAGNNFHGPLPTNMGTNLELLRGCVSGVTGTIPESICSNKKLYFLDILDNFLTGTLPPCLSTLPKLSILQVEINMLTGRVDNVFDSQVQTSLKLVDISDNGFSGAFPAEVFKLPALTSLAAGKNCFHGNFPDTVCGSNALRTMSLDGMGASDQCLITLWDPFHLSNAYFGGLMTGTIPSCVWSLPNITVLHMSGNGFTGQLPTHLRPSCSLKDVVLTHNMLTGTLPQAFQKFPFQLLDLSYNKLKGHVAGMSNLSLSYNASEPGAVLHLENNRLTGVLPHSFSNAYNIDILTGNLFACDEKGKKELVKHDPGNHNAICGSQELDGALSTWGVYTAVAVGILCLCGLLMRIVRGNNHIKKAYRSVKYTAEYIKEVEHYVKVQSRREEDGGKFTNIYQLLTVLSLIRRIGWIVAIVGLLICAPIYVGFYLADDSKYSTHSNRYSWVVSSVFLTGQLPAAICFFLWSVIILLVIHSIVKHYNLHCDADQSVLSNMSRVVSETSSKMRESFRNSILAAPFLSPDQRASLRKSSPSISDLSFNNIPADMLQGYDDGESGISSKLGKEEPLAPSDKTCRASIFSPSTWRFTYGMSDKNSIAKIDLAKDVTTAERSQFWANTLKYFLIFSLNFSVAISVNAAYLVVQNGRDIPSEQKIAVQVLMAGFKIFWSIFVIRLMMTQLPYKKNSVKLHVGMLVFNSIFAPCIATCFTDSACFKDCFVTSEAVTTSYSLTSCIESYQQLNTDTGDVDTVCTHFENSELDTVYNPTFIYYYTCGSKLLTAYTPVFIYIYTILLIFLPILYTTLAAVRTNRWPNAIIAAIDGVVRPNDRGNIVFTKLIRSSAMQAIMINHIIVLLSFGVCSPMLALVMAVALTVDTAMWQIIITRYIKYDTPDCPFSPKYHTKDYPSSESAKSSFLSIPMCCPSSKGVYGKLSTEDMDIMHGVKKPMDEEQKEVSDFISNPMMISSGSPDNSMRMSLSSGSMRVTNDVLYRLLYDPQHKIRAANPEDSKDEEHYQEKVREEARLYELNTVCGEAWKSMRNAMWLVIYCTVFFYTCILYDVAGDSSGWLGAIWVVVYGFIFVLSVRLFYIDIVHYLYDKWIGNYSYHTVDILLD
ncbi:hypothetical protein EON65_15370 [archaeon]|nr:MAG: hypothetical protein EON65_15370 [archaeon]